MDKKSLLESVEGNFPASKIAGIHRNLASGAKGREWHANGLELCEIRVARVGARQKPRWQASPGILSGRGAGLVCWPAKVVLRGAVTRPEIYLGASSVLLVGVGHPIVLLILLTNLFMSVGHFIHEYHGMECLVGIESGHFHLF